MYNDGFNERMNYIHNSLDKQKVDKLGPSNVDSSFAQMNVNSHKNDVKTVDTNQVVVTPEVRGNKENFIVRNKNMMNAQMSTSQRQSETVFTPKNNNFINSQNMFGK